MKSIVGKSVTVVLLLAVAGGLAAWLVFGDKISAALSGEPQTVSPLTAPVERGSVQQTVTGVGEVKPLETVKLSLRTAGIGCNRSTRRLTSALLQARRW